MDHLARRNFFTILILAAFCIHGCGAVPGAPAPVSLPNETKAAESSLSSLELISDFPFYTMRYEGDYGFKAYLESLNEQLSITDVPVGRRSEVQPLVNLPAFACTGFTARSPQGERLLGRNFDWYRHPALLLFTDSPDGYASASMVDISYLGYQGLLDMDDPAMLEDLLKAPYLPFDGLNERGLAVGMMAVPHGEGGADAHKATLDSLEVIRLLLDYAANLDEALVLMEKYNLDFNGGPPLHYLIADSSGASAVVEYIGGKLRIFRSDQPWQVSTNFLFSEIPLEHAGQQCWRYDLTSSRLSESEGVLTPLQAMSLLQRVSQDGQTGTIWSVVYNLSSGEIQVVIDREYEQRFSFQLGG